MKKYVVDENGMLKTQDSNPNFQPTTLAAPNHALTIVSATEDLLQNNIPLSKQTVQSINTMQDDKFLAKFQSPVPLVGADVLDGLTSFFRMYEIPVGLINKLLPLTEYKLDFIIDDSGSMLNRTDVLITDATDYIKRKYDPQGVRAQSNEKRMTRWEEAEDRIHIMIDILAHLPTGPLTFKLINETDPNKYLTIVHTGKTPQEFAAEAHYKVSQLFTSPLGSTPLYRKISESLQANDYTMHYVFTDGVPTDVPAPSIYEPAHEQQEMKQRGVERDDLYEMKKMVIKRNARKHPINFMSCTDKESESEWMVDLDEKADFVNESDDFISERGQVLQNQGPVLPYSRGLWIVCLMAGAIDPVLDALDEKVPLRKEDLDEVMGRRTTQEEYRNYFYSIPNLDKKYANSYQQFSGGNLATGPTMGMYPTQQNTYPNYQASQAPQNMPYQGRYQAPPSTQNPPYNPGMFQAQQPTQNLPYNPGMFQAQQPTQNQPYQGRYQAPPSTQNPPYNPGMFQAQQVPQNLPYGSGTAWNTSPHQQPQPSAPGFSPVFKR